MSPFSRDTGPFKQDWIVQKKGYTASKGIWDLWRNAVYLQGYCFLKESQIVLNEDWS
jgi:hypothetical protein